MIVFYLVLVAVQPKFGKGMFLRLLLGTVAMLAFGYCGEAHFINLWWVGFALGMGGWGFIIMEIVVGEVGRVCADAPIVKYIMRFIGTIGWSI